MLSVYRAKVVEIMNPPAQVTDHFNDLYRLAEAPSTQAQV